jgi:16S rRNA (adenine1518-N6/adenine1519-N6)-dimethyltransferase
MSQIPSTKELIEKYNIRNKKSLGQNFILDKNFTDKIAKSAFDLSINPILEIGAGPGGLTRSLLDAGAKNLFVIEKDEGCLEILKEIKNYHDNLTIIAGDATKIDELEIFKNFINDNKKIKIVANLPYNIGTVLIFKWLKIINHIDSMYLMLQKEVVDKIVACNESPNYGRLSLMINIWCDCRMLFKVNRSVFSPPPKVESAVVEIIPNLQKIKLYSDQKIFTNYEFIIKTAFNQRRKMLKTSLKPYFNSMKFDEKNVEDFFMSCDVKSSMRPEELDYKKFWELAKFQK